MNFVTGFQQVQRPLKTGFRNIHCSAIFLTLCVLASLREKVYLLKVKRLIILPVYFQLTSTGLRVGIRKYVSAGYPITKVPKGICPSGIPSISMSGG